MHIRTTQIQRPGNIVQGRHQHTVGMLITQRLTDTGYLVVYALACIFQRVDFHRILRDVRTVLPDQLQGVEIRTERDTTLLAEVGNQILYIAGRAAPAVDAHLCTCPAFTTDPFRNSGRTFYLQFHQLILGAFQLLLGRQEITRVGPEGGGGHRDDGRTRRAVET